MLWPARSTTALTSWWLAAMGASSVKSEEQKASNFALLYSWSTLTNFGIPWRSSCIILNGAVISFRRLARNSAIFNHCVHISMLWRDGLLLEKVMLMERLVWISVGWELIKHTGLSSEKLLSTQSQFCRIDLMQTWYSCFHSLASLRKSCICFVVAWPSCVFSFLRWAGVSVSESLEFVLCGDAVVEALFDCLDWRA